MDSVVLDIWWVIYGRYWPNDRMEGVVWRFQILLLEQHVQVLLLFMKVIIYSFRAEVVIKCFE